jgi:4-hydroxy-tetrahydrodipicolinate synthase
MTEVMKGIFAVMQTPLKENGDLDVGSLEKQTSFCIECGAHGLVYPVLGGEYQFLSEGERARLVEVVVKTAAGQVPVVAGVAGPVKEVAVECTTAAVNAGADAVVALPPTGGRQAEVREYYEAIAAAAGRPVFLQHTSGGLSANFMRELFAEVEHIDYLKEEQQPSAHQISAVIDEVKEGCLGVFGGGHGRWMLSEMRRGASGFMPAAEAIDVHVQIWDAFQAGDERKARDIFNLLLPQINLIMAVGLHVCKQILVRRGAIDCARMRAPGSPLMDAEDQRELEMIMADLAPYFKV